tara:strand:+ start:56675 stop:57202 length:528 start_codon:yes stop_codon:yes gene_type:complete
MPARRIINTPLCPMTAGATERGVCLLEFGSPERVAREQSDLERLLGEPFHDADHPLLDRLASELDAYFAGDLTRFSIPLDTPGTEWQRRVWDALIRIPFGETTSYGRLAADLGNPGGSRAVGLANGQNRVAIVVPCHRVIAADGTLHGYAGGLDRKRFLLDLEERSAGRALFNAC